MFRVLRFTRADFRYVRAITGRAGSAGVLPPYGYIIAQTSINAIAGSLPGLLV